MTEFQIHLRVSGQVGVLEWNGSPTPDVLREAISMATDDALLARELNRVEVGIPVGDQLARRALHLCGFRFEGVSRQAGQVPDGTWVDVARYARLSGDIVYGPHGFSSVMSSVLPRKRLIAHVLVTDAAGRVALCETSFKPDWELPGGIVEAGESPREAAVREVQEELGIDIALGDLLVADWLRPYLGWEDALELVFAAPMLGDAEVSAVRPDGHEIVEIHWLSLDDAAAKMTDFGAGRLRAAYAALREGRTRYLEGGESVAG